MKLKYLLLTLLCILVGLGIVISLLPQQTRQAIFPTLPTPTPIPNGQTQFTKQLPNIIAVSPGDGMTNVSTTGVITVTFDKSFSLDDIYFALTPQANYSLNKQGNTLIVAFTSPLAQASSYVYLVYNKNNEDGAQTISFTTQGVGEIAPVDTQPSGMPEAEDAFQRQNHPDVFLSNQVPYETANFSATFDYDDSGDGHFFFPVKLLGDQTTAKNAFSQWLSSLGLTKQQISTLDIRYQ